MGKVRPKNRSKRSAGSLPRGVPHRRSAGAEPGGVNPFEHARSANSATRVKHHVHNRAVPGQKRSAGSGSGNSNGGRGEQSSLARSVARRRLHLSAQLERRSKNNQFVDRRIGEAARNKNYEGPSKEDVMLKRIVRERVRRSKRGDRFRLDGDDGEGEGLTHRVSRGSHATRDRRAVGDCCCASCVNDTRLSSCMGVETCAVEPALPLGEPKQTRLGGIIFPAEMIQN